MIDLIMQKRLVRDCIKSMRFKKYIKEIDWALIEFQTFDKTYKSAQSILDESLLIEKKVLRDIEKREFEKLMGRGVTSILEVVYKK